MTSKKTLASTDHPRQISNISRRDSRLLAEKELALEDAYRAEVVSARALPSPLGMAYEPNIFDRREATEILGWNFAVMFIASQSISCYAEFKSLTVHSCLHTKNMVSEPESSQKTWIFGDAAS